MGEGWIRVEARALRSDAAGSRPPPATSPSASPRTHGSRQGAHDREHVRADQPYRHPWRDHGPPLLKGYLCGTHRHRTRTLRHLTPTPGQGSRAGTAPRLVARTQIDGARPPCSIVQAFGRSLRPHSAKSFWTCRNSAKSGPAPLS